MVWRPAPGGLAWLSPVSGTGRGPAAATEEDPDPLAAGAPELEIYI